MTTSATSRITRIARSLAIASMVVLLFGKFVHLSQECHNGCCQSSLTADPSPETYTCQYGCSHVVPADQSDRGDHPNPGHSSHQCAVCNLLLQAPEQPIVLALPDQCGLISETIVLLSDSAVSQPNSQRHLRGPPVA